MELPNRGTSYYLMEFTLTDLKTREVTWTDSYEVRVERCRVELASHEGRIHEAVDRRGGKPGVRQRALHGLGGDLLRTASRSAGVRRLPHADDGDLARDVLEGRRATPVAVRHGPHP